jgi:hypothetical protein
MNLGDQLRATLGEEADVQYATPPDVDRLIIGGRRRKRLRNLTRAGSAALAIVLLGGGAYGVTQLGGGNPQGTVIVDQPTPTAGPSGVGAPPTLADDAGPDDLEAGTYRILVGSDAGGLTEADVTLAGPGWSAGNFPLAHDAGSLGGFGVYQPIALAAGTGCSDDVVTTNLAESPLSLAQQLAELPGSTVLQPVASSEVLGRYAVHVRLRIPQTCPILQYYRPAETPRGGRGVTFDRPDATSPPVIMDFWVFDVDGKEVVVDSWHQADASAELVDKIAQARESITFVTGE